MRPIFKINNRNDLPLPELPVRECTVDGPARVEGCVTGLQVVGVDGEIFLRQQLGVVLLGALADGLGGDGGVQVAA